MKRITTAALALALVGALAAPTSAAQAAPITYLSGTVLYHGQPVAGILVGWFKPGFGSHQVVTTRSDGSYLLEAPKSGQKYVMIANLDLSKGTQSRGNKNYVGVYYGAGDTRDFAYQTLDTYTVGSASDEVDIELAKPGALTGSDENLTLASTLLTLGGTEVKRDSNIDGKAVFTNLVPGQYKLEQPYSYGSGNVVTTDILTVTEGVTTTFDPAVEVGGTVSGVVTGSNGKPAGHIQVSLRSTAEDPELDFDYQDETSGDGSYTFPDLQDSSYELTFGRAAGNYPGNGFVPETVQITGVTDGGTVTHNEKLATGGRIRATVKPTSTSSSNQVTLVGPDGKTIVPGALQTSGTLTFGSLATGQYTLYLTNQTGRLYSQSIVDVKAGKTSDLGTLSRKTSGVTVSGDILGLGSDKGKLKGAIVTLTSPKRPSYDDQVISKNGHFQITGVVRGTYTLEARVPGRATVTRSVTIKRSTDYTGITAGAKLGTAVATITAAARPVADGYLQLDGDSGRPLEGSITDGSFLASGRAGTYTSVDLLEVDGLFQANSPYWAELPDGVLPVTVASAKTTDLGDIDLDVFSGAQAD